MKTIFLSHPFRKDPNYLEHLMPYIKYAWKEGSVPLAPHLLFPVFANEDTERQKIMDGCFTLLMKSDEFWLCGDTISEGMKLELQTAIQTKKLVRIMTLEKEDATTEKH